MHKINNIDLLQKVHKSIKDKICLMRVVKIASKVGFKKEIH